MGKLLCEERDLRMSAAVLEGKAVAAAIREEVRAQVAQLKEKGITPKMAVVLVGDDPASVLYARSKEKACKNSGIDFELHKFAETATEDEVIAKLGELSKDASVHGIMLELPAARMNKSGCDGRQFRKGRGASARQQDGCSPQDGLSRSSPTAWFER